ncbi:Ff.00g064480.m01.CDS01 [Fusarium sp. VM40]|nr:Ff.00g064480.m01.CDS01 [Fusarium sp. VM40]
MFSSVFKTVRASPGQAIRRHKLSARQIYNFRTLDRPNTRLLIGYNQRQEFATIAPTITEIGGGPLKDKTRVGIIGARGYIGQTLIDLLDSHPRSRLTHISSRELAGKPVPNYRKSSAVYEELSPADVGMLEAQKAVDCWVLALPNGLSGPYLAAIDIVASRTDRSTVVVDLSADHRFDSSWTYGLAELVSRTDIARATRIANPGCFATAAQLALTPISKFVGEQPTIFGVSGYSGAGTKPSPKNDLGFLRDNVVPYGVTDHIHEREISARLGYPISFIPHVSS